MAKTQKMRRRNDDREKEALHLPSFLPARSGVEGDAL